MSNKLIKYKFRNEYFAAYGLNKFKNFLNAPICECGCGNKTHILLKDDEALLNLTGQLLSEHDCEHTYTVPDSEQRPSFPEMVWQQ